MEHQDLDPHLWTDAKEPYDSQRSAEEDAASKNCIVVYPQENQLQLDLDNDEAYGLFRNRLGEMYARDVDEAYQLAAPYKVHPSKSGLPHRHVTLTFKRSFSPWERIALQSMLGSDPTREALSALRLIGGDKQPSRLFEQKEGQDGTN